MVRCVFSASVITGHTLEITISLETRTFLFAERHLHTYINSKTKCHSLQRAIFWERADNYLLLENECCPTKKSLQIRHQVTVYNVLVIQYNGLVIIANVY